MSPWSKVLARLGPRDLASLAGAVRGGAAAVAATALMMWAKDEKHLPPRPRSTAFAYPAPRLCLRQACSLAARGGHLEVLKWLHNTGCPWNESCYAAAAGGHLEVVNWLHSTGCTWNEWTCYAAAAGGHLEVVKWLHNAGCPWDSATCGAAASGGHLATLQWTREHGCPWDADLVRAHSARGGNVDILRWLDDQGVP